MQVSPLTLRIARDIASLIGAGEIGPNDHIATQGLADRFSVSRDIIFTGDAAKNRAELISREADMTFDPAVTRRSIETIWALWRAKPGNVVVPGHDLPMQLRGDEPAYLGRRRAAIKAWFQHGIDQMTEISLAEPAGLDPAP